MNFVSRFHAPQGRLLRPWVLALLVAGFGSVAAQAALWNDEAGAQLQATRARLAALKTAGVPAQSYNWAKAQCWVDAATTGWSENDRTGFVQGALAEANKIATVLEGNKTASDMNETPLLVGSARVRPDLWQSIDHLKTQPQAACGAQNLACAEVLLVRAGHGMSQTGERQARPYATGAENALQEAQTQIQTCAAQAAQPVAQEVVTLQEDALFCFDRSALADLLPEGRVKLEQMVAALKGWKRINSIHIKGYSDRLGTAAYNLSLSQARADAIKNFLLAEKLSADVLDAQGLGVADPVTTRASCPLTLGHRAAVACLQPDRRIVVEISGVK